MRMSGTCSGSRFVNTAVPFLAMRGVTSWALSRESRSPAWPRVLPTQGLPQPPAERGGGRTTS